MVNYKRVVCEAALVAALVAVVGAAPAPTPAPARDCDEKYYDQSQNGTENYRLNIDGVVIAIAPAETLMAAASDIDLSEFLALTEEFNDFQKPKPPASAVQPEWNKPQDYKPSDSKPSEDPKPSPKPDEPAQGVVATKSDIKSDNNEFAKRKAQRIKQRLANIILPLLKRSHHHDHHGHHDHHDQH